MLLKQIRYFVMVVECGSFTEAAVRCYISQSAVSQQVKALEDELGVQLFNRGKRNFTLTEAGKYMYRHGRELIQDAEKLTDEVIKIGKTEGCPRIRIGYLKLYSGNELSAAIAQFRQKMPEFVIDIKSVGHDELYRGIYNGSFDVVLNDERFDGMPGDFEYFTLKESNVYIDISEQYELSSRPYIDAGEPRGIPCIIVVDKAQRSDEKAFYAKRYGTMGANFIYAGDWGEARMLVAAGAGFSVVENTDSAFVPGKGVKRIPVYKNGEPLKWQYYFICRKEKQNEAKKYLTELVINQFKQGTVI